MDTTTALKVSEILGQRLAVLSAQDVESRQRTTEALASLRALIKQVEAIDFDD